MRYLAVLAILLCACAGAARAQEIPRTCGSGVTVTLAEDASGKFDIIRACELYGDLLTHHIPNAIERPGAVFYVVRDLEKSCREADLTSSLGNPPVMVACLRRSRTATEIWLAEDKPEHYAIAMMDGADYANRLYLPREFIGREVMEAIAELTRPELRRRFHGSVGASELRRKP